MSKYMINLQDEINRKRSEKLYELNGKLVSLAEIQKDACRIYAELPESKIPYQKTDPVTGITYVMVHGISFVLRLQPKAP